MTFRELLDVREESTKLALLSAMDCDEATIDKINAAFEEGARLATGQLVAAFGEDEAYKAIEMIDEEIISSGRSRAR